MVEILADWVDQAAISPALAAQLARAWFEYYHRLNTLVTMEPSLLSAVIAVVQQAAALQRTATPARSQCVDLARLQDQP
jgi:hypothetical protein